MNITKKNHYLYVTDIENFTEAVSECCKEYENGYYAAIFEIGSAELDADTKKALADAPFTTAVHTNELSASNVEDLLSFDLRFSADTLKADRETAKKLSENESFRILFSDKRAYELKKFTASDSIEETVLDYGIGETGGYVGDAGTLTHCLFHFGIHENGAACAQVVRMLCFAGDTGEVSHSIAQHFGKGLNKRTASGRAGFVDFQPSDSLILNKYSFHILPADV